MSRAHTNPAQFLSSSSTATTSNMYKAVVIAALVAVANAGIIGAPLGYAAAPVAYSAPTAYAQGYASPALVSQQNNILRTPGNLGQVSTYSKTITTPYSSVSKSDVRVSNDALAYPGAYASPVVAARVAAPVLAAPAYAHAAPVLAAPAVAHAAPLGVAYSASPVVSHFSFDGLGAHYAY